ncbi:MAG TPA: YbaB/EbfC family nucleoid-associated protein [Planctomycetota bacterium]|nr:YbaB/EbfC family nucleoid-associated protein [Planctomycetota bacterium]
MTGFPGAPGDFGAIFERAKKAREDVERARASLRERRVEGHAGGGMVTATCDGTGELVRIRFEPGLLAKEEGSLVEDLVVAAVRDARRRAAELERETMGGVLGGLTGGLPIPPGLADLLR